MKKQQSFISQAKAILFQVSKKKKPNHLTSCRIPTYFKHDSYSIYKKSE
jgi:hypothetical protein